eukprot:860072_1
MGNSHNYSVNTVQCEANGCDNKKHHSCIKYNVSGYNVVRMGCGCCKTHCKQIENPANINKKVFIKTSAIKKKYYSEFPTLNDYANNCQNNNTQAVKLTTKILASKPSGDPSNNDTLFHILNASANNNGKKCLFIDSSKNIKSPLAGNSYLNIIDGNDKESEKFVLTLKSLDNLIDDEKYEKADKLIELKQSISNNTYNATINSIRTKLAEAHEVDAKRILIKDVYLNGVGVAYTVKDLTENKKNKIITQTR